MTLVGGFDETYPRTNVIIEGCKANGVDLDYIKVPWSSPFKRRLRLKRALKKETIRTDFAFVPAFCHHEVAVVKKMSSKPVVFDPLISRYLTKIHDYRRAHRFSVHAVRNYLIDKSSMSAADYVLSDTVAHKDYFCTKFKIPPDKIYPLYLGYRSDHFFPRQNHSPGETLTVGFYGSFAPLHGVEVIVGAADLLRDRPDLKFEIIGKGYTYDEVINLVRSRRLGNIHFQGRVPYEELGPRIGEWDICLGIFGGTLKADLVIPHKVFHYAGCRKPIITKKSPAIEEIFSDGEDIFLCDPSPRALADRIVELAEDVTKRDSAALKAHRLVHDHYTEVRIGEALRRLLEQWT